MSTGSLKYLGCCPRKFMGLCTVSLRNNSMSTGSLKYLGCCPRKFMGLCTVSLRNNSLLDILLGTKRLQWAGLAKVQGLCLGAPHDLATVMKYLSNSLQDTSLYVVLMTLYVACMSLYVVFIICARGTNYKCVTKFLSSLFFPRTQKRVWNYCSVPITFDRYFN
jgi:hypothetical protein